MDRATEAAIESGQRGITEEQKQAMDVAIRMAGRAGRRFSANEVWAYVPAALVPENATTLGGRLLAAARAGEIRKVGQTTSERTHGSVIARWEATRG